MDKISIITATFNAEDDILGLINSLEKQTSSNFEWIVVDSCSEDQTLSLVEKSSIKNKVIIREKDFGIYDALNKGIAAVSSSFYVVIGADDTFDEKMTENFLDSLNKFPGFDFYAAGWKVGGVPRFGMSGKGWLYGMVGEASCHSVSLLIKTELHQSIGLYSKLFPICADQLFVKSAINQGARVKHCSFVSGEFSEEGLSSSNSIGLLTESYRVQLITERFKFLQTGIFLIKLLKNFKSIF